MALRDKYYENEKLYFTWIHLKREDKIYAWNLQKKIEKQDLIFSVKLQYSRTLVEIIAFGQFLI